MKVNDTFDKSLRSKIKEAVVIANKVEKESLNSKSKFHAPSIKRKTYNQPQQKCHQ